MLIDFLPEGSCRGLAPYPLLLCEEYGEENPFLFFTDYSEPQLKKSVYAGRRREFKDFGWDQIPNPEDDRTFYRSRLTPPERWKERQVKLFHFYRELISLRKRLPALRFPEKKSLEIKVYPESKVVEIKRRSPEGEISGWFNLGLISFPLGRRYPRKRLYYSKWVQFGGEERLRSKQF